MKVNPLFCCVALVIVGILAYLNSFQIPFQFDDYAYSVMKNQEFQGIETIFSLFSEYPARFFGLLSLSLDKRIYGLDPYGYHYLNLFFHISNAILVFHLLLLFLRRFSDSWNDESLVTIAAICSCLFLLHPLMTQAVSYIAQRYTCMMTSFFLLSLYLYLLSTNYEGVKKRAILSFGFVFGVMACMTKENAVVLPIIVVLCHFYLKIPLRLTKVELFKFSTLLFLLVLPFILTFMGNSVTLKDVGRDQDINSLTYFLTQPYVVMRYAQLFFVPLGQTVDHGVTPISNVYSMLFWMPLLLHLFFLWFAFRVRNSHRLFSFGVCFFYVCLIPESSFIALPDLMFEHRAYLPSIGVVMCIASFTTHLYTPRHRNKILGVSCLVATVFFYLTVQRNTVWQSKETLWGEAIKVNPQNTRPYHILGNHFFRNSSYDRSIEHYLAVLRIDSNDLTALKNLGVAYGKKGDLPNSILSFQKVVELDPNASSYRDLAQAFQINKDYDLAKEAIQKCLQIEVHQGCQERMIKILRDSGEEDQIKEFKQKYSIE